MSLVASRSMLVRRRTGSPQHPHARLDRRPRAGVAAVDAQVDREVEHPRALGIVHAEKENIRPAAVRQVEPHRRALAQDRVEAAARRARQQLAPHAHRMVVDVADAEHPLVAARAADRPADLVGQGLERQVVIALGQRAVDRAVGAVAAQDAPERGDGLLVAAVEKLLVAAERHEAARGHALTLLEMEPIAGEQKYACAHALIEVVGARAKRLEILARRGDLLDRHLTQQIGQRPVADPGVVARNRFDQSMSHGLQGHSKVAQLRSRNYITPWNLCAV